MAVMATVATRPLATRAASVPPAMSIWDSTQPPKMSPLPFMSAGCGTVLMIGSRRLSDINSPPDMVAFRRFSYHTDAVPAIKRSPRAAEEDKKQPWRRTAICSIGRGRQACRGDQGQFLHRARHRGAGRARARPQAPRHVCRRHRRAGDAPSRGRGARQRHGRGRRRPRRHDPSRAAQPATRPGARQRPRHPGRPASQVQEQVGARGHPHHAAFRRQVQQQGLRDLGRPARRRRLGGQCAVGRAGRRGRARSPVLDADLLARQAHVQAQVGRPCPQPARHDGHLPSRSGDLRQAGLRRRAALPHGALQGLPVPRRRDPLEVRQDPAAQGRHDSRRGVVPLRRWPEGLPDVRDRRAPDRGAAALRRRGQERDQRHRRRQGRMGGVVAERRGRLRPLLLQHRADGRRRHARIRASAARCCAA